MHERNVLLLVDNSPCHVPLELTNVRIHFLPKNTTSYLQSMDAGIIKNFKYHYKRRFLRWLLDQIQASSGLKRIDLLSAINFAIDAWLNVSATTIRNCWGHAGIVSGAMLASLKNDNKPRRNYDFSDLDALIGQLKLDDPLSAQEYLAIEDNSDM